MTKKTKAKLMTFRQRLREQAGYKLNSMLNAVQLLAAEAVKAEDSEINPADVMRLASSAQTKSLRWRLITELANEKVAELERIYNNQIALDLGDEKSSDDAT